MPEIKIRRFQPDEGQLYRQIRLHALADAPYAFGTTLAEATARTDSKWEDRFSQALASDLELPLLALVADQPAGLAWGHIDSENPPAAHLFQMWVDPAYRRMNIGLMLVEAVIAWIKEHPVAYLELDVAIANPAALALYQKCGFVKWGSPHSLRPSMDMMSQTMRYQLSE